MDFDDLLDNDVTLVPCALVCFPIFAIGLKLILAVDIFQRWLLCM